MQSLAEVLQNKQIERKLVKPLYLIELPAEVAGLIHNPVYNNRYKWLLREYGEEWLLTVAKMAKLGRQPQRLFAKMCSKLNEGLTNETVTKYLDKGKAVARALKERPTVYAGWLYKNFKRVGTKSIDIALKRSSDSPNAGASFVQMIKEYNLGAEPIALKMCRQ